MRNYTIEEKQFVVNNAPRIEIEKIEFGYCSESFGNDSPAEEVCFLTKEGQDAFYTEDGAEGVEVTFHFRDTGVDLVQKHVSFMGFAQIYDYDGDELLDFVCDIEPEIMFPAVADKDGRFSVTVPMLLSGRYEDKEDEDKSLIDRLRENKALFQFYGVVVSNQFAKERFGHVTGNFMPEGEKIDFGVGNITYCLADEPDIEEDFLSI